MVPARSISNQVAPRGNWEGNSVPNRLKYGKSRSANTSPTRWPAWLSTGYPKLMDERPTVEGKDPIVKERELNDSLTKARSDRTPDDAGRALARTWPLVVRI